MSTANLVLHPVRLRIVKAFLPDRALTTSELLTELDDVPAGSLYRHVARLAEAGILQVVAERRVRGAVERTYTLRLLASQIAPGEVADWSKEDHARAFAVFVAGLLADFDRYLDAGIPDVLRDGLSYGTAAVWLTDEEYRQLLREIALLLQPRLANVPGPGRRRRLISSVLMPAPDPMSLDHRARGSRSGSKPGTTARSRELA
jgi:hypothetical protein